MEAKSKVLCVSYFFLVGLKTKVVFSDNTDSALDFGIAKVKLNCLSSWETGILHAFFGGCAQTRDYITYDLTF